MARRPRRGIGAYYEQATPRKSIEVRTHEVAEPTSHGIAHHRVADVAGDDEPDQRPGIHRFVRSVASAEQVNDDSWPSRAATAPDGQGEVVPPPHPVPGRQHCEGVRQTAMRARPLLRREERTARPARVRIRSRKPCFLWRRRLFGWKVRLLTRGSSAAVELVLQAR
jgi:hypothetical protein